MEQRTVLLTAAACLLLIVITGVGIWLFMRKRFVSYTEAVCRSIDGILAGRGVELFDVDEDTLLSKVQMKLKRLEEITAALAADSERGKQEVQGILSDLSHQLKTPVSNVMMYCDTAMNPALSEAERARCMEILKGQVEKLDFLVQAMIRMARLEQNMIVLHPDRVRSSELLRRAEEDIRAEAEAKDITVEVECGKDSFLYCDEKWTAEALLNILDNSVKYSPAGSRITICSERLESYTKIQITDEGMGILPEHAADVCKRFFREERAAKVEGLGIGLYLTREILEKESGYLKIHSVREQGTTVSVYLPNAAETEG